MAGTINLYPNLPGHLVEFKDGGMVLRNDPTPQETDSVLLLGTAVDGPINEPIAIDMSTIETLFGKEVTQEGAPNGATLVKAAKQLYQSGTRDIRVMRVTGSSAKAVIKKEDTMVSTVVSMEEDLGLCGGNAETVITLKQRRVVSGSVRVSANGVPLTTGIKVNDRTATVTIAENTCQAGAHLQVTYSYTENANITDKEFTVAKGLKVRLPFSPVAAITVKKAEGEVIESGKYTVRGADVVFKSESQLSVGDVVKVTYNGETKDVVTAVEASSDGLPIIAETSEQEFILSQSPADATVYVYADGVQVSHDTFSIDLSLRKIIINKEYFPLGSLISASYSYASTEEVTESIQFETIYGGDVYNQSSIAVREIRAASTGDVIGKEISLTKPASKRSQVTEAPLVYRSIDYPTFGQLVNAINSDVNNNVFKAFTDHPEALTRDLSTNVTATNAAGQYFMGGDNGISVSKVEMYEALSGKRDEEGYLITEGAYQLLEDYTVDWVVPVGVYADDKLPGRYQNFAYELALFCSVLSYRNKTTLGVIGMKPCVDTTLAGIKRYVDGLAAYENHYYMRDDKGNILIDSSGSPIDLGMFLSVVGGPDPIFNSATLGAYTGEAAVAYAGVNSVILPQNAPTNKAIEGARGLRFRLSNKQHNDILGNRIVTLKIKADNATVCAVDGVTAANFTSDYTRLSTAKVVRETVDQIREVAEPFIGQPNTVEQRNALSSAISKRLSTLQTVGVISGYEFGVIASQADQVLGNCRIELTIMPPQELRKITTIVGLRA